MNLLEALRYLAALEQHRHFGRAAQACHITQPALSNAIRALESHFGVTIVRRSRQYEGLTPEGVLALSAGHRMLHEAESLRQALASRAGAPQGGLQIGAVPTALPIAARFAARLRVLHPGLRPVLRSLSSPEIDAGLDNLSLDLALGYSHRPEVPARHLVVWPQYGEHYFVVQQVGAATQAFAFGPPITWLEAGTLALVMLTPEMHNRQLVDAAFLAAGPRPQPALETNSVLALLVAVQSGASYSSGSSGSVAAVLPGALVATLATQGALEARPLTAPVLRTPIGFITAPAVTASRAVAAALALAQDADWLAEAAAHSGPLATREA